MKTYTTIERELVDVPELSEAERKRLADFINKKIEKTMFGGWPPGCDPNPTTLYIGTPPRCCHGSVIHAPNCPTWGVTS